MVFGLAVMWLGSGCAGRPETRNKAPVPGALFFQGNDDQRDRHSLPSTVLLPPQSRSAIMAKLSALIRISRHAVLSAEDEFVITGKTKSSKGGKRASVRFNPMLLTTTLKRTPTDPLPYGNRTFQSCAVVGNSGVLLGSNFGVEIDSHDAVMRINYPPTHGYESDVGSKTTFDMVNRANIRRIARQSNAHHLNIRESTYLSFVSGGMLNSKLFIKAMKWFHERFPSRLMLVAHPIFHEELSDMFIKVKEAIELQNKTSLASIPNSGVRAVVFMTQVCERLHAYGFTPYKQKFHAGHSNDGVPYHYFTGHAHEDQPMFDMEFGGKRGHSYDLAHDFLKLLREVYPLDLK